MIRDGRVRNIIFVADDWPEVKKQKDKYVPPEGDLVIFSEDAQMYDHYSEADGFTRGEPPPRPEPRKALSQDAIDRIYKLLEREGL